MSISYISDYITRARGRMIQQFKAEEAPDLDKVLQTFIAEIQEIEDVIYSLSTERAVATASGEQLDVVADIVGIDREGRTDNELRDAIYVQIAVNNGGGQEEIISRLAALITGASIVEITELFPAKIQIFVNTAPPSGIANSLRPAIGAAIGFGIVYTTGGADPFIFAGGSTGAGFGSIHDASLGGEFVATIEGI